MFLSKVQVGRNGWGSTVLFCILCLETFDKEVPNGITVEELVKRSNQHECDPEDLKFAELLKNSSVGKARNELY